MFFLDDTSYCVLLDQVTDTDEVQPLAYQALVPYNNSSMVDKYKKLSVVVVDCIEVQVMKKKHYVKTCSEFAN